MLPSFKNVPSIYYLIIMALAIEEVMSIEFIHSTGKEAYRRSLRYWGLTIH